MITTAIFNVLFFSLKNLVVPVVSKWQNVSQVNLITTAITTVSSYISALDMFLPMASLLAILFLVVLIEGSYWGVKLLNWAIRKIPGVN